MKDGSWEDYWYTGQPSPMERVIIECRVCKDVMPFHLLVFRPATRSDIFYANSINFKFEGICPDCFDKQQEEASEEENEES